MELWENCPGENKLVAPKIQNMCFTTTTTTCRRRQSLQSLPASVEILLGYRYCNLRWSTNTAANHCLDIDEKPMLQPPLDIDEIPIQLPANVEIPMRYRCCSHRWATDIVANHCWDTDCAKHGAKLKAVLSLFEAALSHQNRNENWSCTQPSKSNRKSNFIYIYIYIYFCFFLGARGICPFCVKIVQAKIKNNCVDNFWTTFKKSIFKKETVTDFLFPWKAFLFPCPYLPCVEAELERKKERLLLSMVMILVIVAP